MNEELLQYPDVVTARSLKYYQPSQTTDVEKAKPKVEESFGGKAIPRSYTRLYLRAAEEIVKTMNKDLADLFQYDLSIPVSPSQLEYSRSADHNEVYSIVKGGLLQRNLPNLWHTTITSYLPKDIMERAFHNYFVTSRGENAKKEKYKQAEEANDATSGMATYSQQMFVDYMNRIMDNKVPMELWDDSNPVRIAHQPKYFCVLNFTYTMLPHDDINITIELVEWKEPVVILKDLVTITDEEETDEDPPVRKGGTGNAIMAFGITDTRAYDRARVYRSDIKNRYADDTGMLKGYAARDENLDEIYKQSIAYAQYLVTHITLPQCSRVSVTATMSETTYPVEFSVLVTAYVDMSLPEGAITTSQLRSYGLDKLANRIESGSLLEREILRDLRNANINNIVKRCISLGASDQKIIPSQITLPLLTQTSKYIGETSSLPNSAWCKKIKTVKIPFLSFQFKPTTPIKSLRVNNINGATGIVFTFDGSASVEEKGGKKTMYVLKPIAGKDKMYDPKQTFLCPKENTIVTTYQNYIDTFNASFGDKKTTRLIKTGENEYYNNYQDMEINTTLPITVKTGKKIPANVSGAK